MRPFTYHEPASLTEAFDLLDTLGEDAHLIAGGTALVLLMKQGLVQPEHVVSLRAIPGLADITPTPDGGLRIGALATHRDAETSPHVRAYDAALAEAFGHVATIRIRNQATVGGNLAHADPAQDPPPMLLALGAEVVAASRAGERTIPLDAFFVDYFETALRPGEVLVAINLPPRAAGLRTHYAKFLPRTVDDYATVAVAAAVRFEPDGQRVADVRLALGAAGPTVIRATQAEAALRGQTLTSERIREAAALAREASDPLDDSRGSADYKREMVEVWVRRALNSVAADSRGA